MKETNLNLFYELGQTLTTLHDRANTGKKIVDIINELFMAQVGLGFFLRETEDYSLLLEDTRGSARFLLDSIDQIMKSAQLDMNRPLTQEETRIMHGHKWNLDKHFERERRNLSVFAVTPKGIYDTHLLIEKPELKFPEKIRPHLPQQMLYDLKQAGRCLAFDVPTACAFHVCRGTEAVMLAYYELLAKHPWNFKKKDWNIYIEQLIQEKAPTQITQRLEEIRKLDRNAYIHPDVNVTLDESPILFDLCTGVVYLMGIEMGKLTP